MTTEKLTTFSMAADCSVLTITSSSAQPVQQGGYEFPDFIPLSSEGVTLDNIGNVYLGVSVDTDQIWQLSPCAEQRVFSDLGQLGGWLTGLAVDAVGDVYIAVPFRGVYRVGRNAAVTHVPGTERIVFPNALAFDHRGTLYITESFSFDDPTCGPFGKGGIWRVPKGGTAELWVHHELLTGNCPPAFFAEPYGANGIAFYHGDLYVASSEKALVLRIPVQLDGSPGPLEIWKQVADVPESPLYQNPWIQVFIDGLALDTQGNVYVAVGSREAIVRINADDRTQSTVAVFPDAPLDVPMSLAFGTGKGARKTLFVTNAGFSQSYVPGLPWVGSGLAIIELDRPGRPLP